MLKMAVFGPIPRVRAPITASEKPGDLISIRTANRRSDHKALMSPSVGKHVANKNLVEFKPRGSRRRVPGVRLRDCRVRVRTVVAASGLHSLLVRRHARNPLPDHQGVD